MSLVLKQNCTDSPSGRLLFGEKILSYKHGLNSANVIDSYVYFNREIFMLKVYSKFRLRISWINLDFILLG